MTYKRFTHSFVYNIVTRFTFTLLFSTIAHRALSYQTLRRSLTSYAKMHATKPSAKEIIFYIHGWQRAPAALKWGADQDLAKAAAAAPQLVFKEISWRDKAYSYDVRQAQHHIWADTDSFHDKLMTDIYEVLEAHPKVPFRLTGHSLGCQLTLKLSQRLIYENQLSKNYWPRRIALLEPAFVRNLTSRDGDTENSRDKCLKILEKIATNDIAVEIYRSSVLTRNCLIGYSNQQLVNTLPFPSVDINYPLANFLNLQETHNGAKTFYFRTFMTPPHTICGTVMPYAASPTEHVMQSYGRHFEQIVGGAHGGMFLKTAKDQAPAKCPLKNLWNFFIGAKSTATQTLDQKQGPLLFSKKKDSSQNLEKSGVHVRSKYK